MRINRSIRLKIDGDMPLICFICFYFLIQALNLFIKLTMSEPSWWGLISKMVLAGLLAPTMISVIKRNSGIILMEIVAMGMLLISFLSGSFSPEYSETQSVIFNYIFVYTPLGMALYSVRNMERTLDILYKFAWVLLFILLLAIYLRRIEGLFGNSVAGTKSYDMSIGYAILLQVLIILDHFFEKKRPRDILASCIGVLTIFLFSSRTPLLCVIVYIYIRVFQSQTVKTKTKVRMFMVTIFAIIAVIVFYIFLAKPLYSKLVEMGFDSTALRKLLLTPLDDSSRSVIYIKYIEHTMNRPILGYGVLGGWFLGTYPHSIIIEAIHSFGIIIGSLSLGLLLILIYSGVKGKDKGISRMVFILTGYNFYLLLSGSFLTSVAFMMLIAICIKARRNRCIMDEIILSNEIG